MLIGQHISLNDEPVAGHVGIICTETSIAEVAREAIENSRFICEEYYGLFKAPVVELYCRADLRYVCFSSLFLFDVVFNCH